MVLGVRELWVVAIAYQNDGYGLLLSIKLQQAIEKNQLANARGVFFATANCQTMYI